MPRVPSEADAVKLQEMWRWYLTQRALGGGRGATMVPPGTRVAKTDGSGITAASGTTAGSGTVTLQEFDGTTLAASTDTGGSDNDITAYSFVEAASGTSTYVFVVQDADGYWWYVAEAC